MDFESGAEEGNVLRPGAVPMLLPHGTGGNEDDLLSLGAALAPGAPLLNPRGQALENGIPRFFHRLAEGVFDLEDLRFRTQQLADFLDVARRTYSLGETPPIALGFSNGANIAAALLLLHPGSLSAALLLRPMVPLVPDPLPALEGVRVLIAAGRHDPIVQPAQSQALADLLNRAGAEVTLQWSSAGHGLTREDLQAGERLDGGVRSFFSYVDFRGFALVDVHPRVSLPWRLASPAQTTCRPYASSAGDSREELCDASCRP